MADLWLREADAGRLDRARAVAELAPHCGDPEELAAAYTELFLLNVYPYASVYLDRWGELNGDRAREAERLYETHGYNPPELGEVAAPDHIGLMLGCLGHVGQVGQDAILPYILDWAPVLCLAVEREPSAHAFYRALAGTTRDALFSAAARTPLSHTSTLPRLELASDPDEEISLRRVVRHLLTPARSGVFLSRARLGAMAREMGRALPFGERLQVGMALFDAAGAAGQVLDLLDRLEAEISVWDEVYARWEAQTPGWAPYAVPWRSRAAATQRMLGEMRLVAADEQASLE